MTSRQSPRPWRAGVIAAGRGERLQNGRPRLKPLVPVGGLTLVERVLSSLGEAEPAEVVVIVNEASIAVKDHVSSRPWPFALRWIVETTPSSMHSFLRVVEALAADGDSGPFLLSTVDTVAQQGAFGAFAEASRESDADVTLAIIPTPDDDKPLLVGVRPPSDPIGDWAGVRRVSDPNRATALSVDTIGADAAGSPWATAGYYAVRASILREADEARRDGVTALRAFLGRLLARGFRVNAVPVAPGIDVDRPSDIRAAEAFLKQVGV
jgi:NDP-sugar pyrophosphorylase family protein